MYTTKIICAADQVIDTSAQTAVVITPVARRKK